MTETTKNLLDPMYRLFRKMDGEIVLQYFVEGHWVNVETVNEGQNGITSSNAS
jgi:hypothetical protein